ncbi:uncharacterized protein N7518_005909 [Penicillium psychrosexuale]|uniref:uncharacterized protein n=1 Tax=Penicillium psychrosexuale TaxID=1002107 RepID=UPI00254572E2|nr:uncharacterized protein N7518_005909 [Penicillium psychrosexuale]KAJ5788898.1 hypothetical protein N7518_005909 [Penicillium psychrosexuale]
MGAVLVDVGVVLAAILIPRAVLELDICREEISKLAKHRITRVAIWGLVGDSYESPFDMIDAPPSYEQIAKDKASTKKKDKTR